MTLERDLPIAGVALLYNKRIQEGTEQMVQVVLVNIDKGDDNFDLIAKAERYVFQHEVLSESVKGFTRVSWSISSMVEEAKGVSHEI
jgi:hypothetical protein